MACGTGCSLPLTVTVLYCLTQQTIFLHPSLQSLSSLSPSSLSLSWAWEHKLWYRTDTAQQKLLQLQPLFFSFFFALLSSCVALPTPPHNSSSTLHTPHHSPHEK